MGKMGSSQSAIRKHFTSEHGRFLALPGKVERVDGAHLKAAFLPRLTQEGKRLVRKHQGNDFVRGQLMHYGIIAEYYDEDSELLEVAGDGISLLQEALLAGKCDRVPAYIEEMRWEMHEEWLETKKASQLLDRPDLILQKYFVDARTGKPDREKRSIVGCVVYPYTDRVNSAALRLAASGVEGLYQATAFHHHYGGDDDDDDDCPNKQVIWLGWDREEVFRAAGDPEYAGKKREEQGQEQEQEEQHGADPVKVEDYSDSESGDEEEEQEKETKRKFKYEPLEVCSDEFDDYEFERTRAKEREDARAARHQKFVKRHEKYRLDGSPVGTYMIDCAKIEGNWDNTDDMTMSVWELSPTDHPGIYQASFDFGVIEGIMMLSADEEALDRYCEENENSVHSSDEQDEEEPYYLESKKRKATSSSTANSSAKTKKPKTNNLGGDRPALYHLRLKYHDTGTSEISFFTEKGTIRFDDARSCLRFTGRFDIVNLVGQNVPFTGRKIDDKATESGEQWCEYSEGAHEAARIARWH